MFKSAFLPPNLSFNQLWFRLNRYNKLLLQSCGWLSISVARDFASLFPASLLLRLPSRFQSSSTHRFSLQPLIIPLGSYQLFGFIPGNASPPPHFIISLSIPPSLRFEFDQFIIRSVEPPDVVKRRNHVMP